MLIAKNQNYYQATITGSKYSLWQLIKYAMNLRGAALKGSVLH